MIRPLRARPALYQHGEPVALRLDGKIEHCNRQVKRFLGYVESPTCSVMVRRPRRSEGTAGTPPLVSVRILGFAADVVRAVAA